MRAFAGEHYSELVPQKNSRHWRTRVFSYGTAKEIMISGSGLNEGVRLRQNDLQEVLRMAASEGCESTQEEVRSHQPVRGAVECAMFIQLVLNEELEDQRPTVAAAQEERRQPDNAVQEPRGNTCRAYGAS